MCDWNNAKDCLNSCVCGWCTGLEKCFSSVTATHCNGTWIDESATCRHDALFVTAVVFAVLTFYAIVVCIAKRSRPPAALI